MRIRRIVMKRKRVSFLMVVLLALLLAAGCSGGSSSSGPSTVVPPKDDGSNGGEGGDEGDESKTLAKIEIVSIEMTGPSSVVVYCNTTDDGNGELKEMGVCYGTSADPDMSDSYEKYYDVHLGEFFLDIANIPSGILHFRPRVVNSAGESYGKDAILSWRTSGITGLTTSDGENLYVAINKGEHNGDLYLAKMRQSDGDMVWEKPASTAADRYDECRGITYLNGSIFMIVVENMPMFPGDTAQLPLNTGVIWFKRFNAETGELEKEEIIKDYGAVLDGGIVPDVSTGLLYMGYCTGAGAEYIIQLDQDSNILNGAGKMTPMETFSCKIVVGPDCVYWTGNIMLGGGYNRLYAVKMSKDLSTRLWQERPWPYGSQYLEFGDRNDVDIPYSAILLPSGNLLVGGTISAFASVLDIGITHSALVEFDSETGNVVNVFDDDSLEESLFADLMQDEDGLYSIGLYTDTVNKINFAEKRLEWSTSCDQDVQQGATLSGDIIYVSYYNAYQIKLFDKFTGDPLN